MAKTFDVSLRNVLASLTKMERAVDLGVKRGTFKAANKVAKRAKEKIL